MLAGSEVTQDASLACRPQMHEANFVAGLLPKAHRGVSRQGLVEKSPDG